MASIDFPLSAALLLPRKKRWYLHRRLTRNSLIAGQFRVADTREMRKLRRRFVEEASKMPDELMDPHG